jgi:hypothetical protein
MEIKLSNIHNRLNYFTEAGFGICNITWAEPIAVSMIKAYQTDKNISDVAKT